MKVGTISGTRIEIHPSFWLVFAFVAFVSWTAGLELPQIAVELGFLGALFACVVLHEFGHVLAARRYGIRTETVTLYPIGGVARLERMPETPARELVVALAGPLVNVLIAIVAGAAFWLVPGGFLARLALVNLVLVLFNLLPAFPMDGGRVLRALLAMRQPYVRATETAAFVGRLMAVCFGAAGLIWNPFLVVIGIFVWLGATAEARGVRARASLAGARVMQVSMAKVLVLQPEDRLSRAVELTLDSPQKDFPVTMDGEIVGALTQRALLRAIESDGAAAAVADVMRASPPTVEAESPLEEAVDILRGTRSPFLPITDDGELVGIVTMDNVREFMELRQALGGRSPIRTPQPIEPHEPETSPDVAVLHARC